jgi:hypothetical protein
MKNTREDTKVDIAMNAFISMVDLYPMSSQEIGEFQDRANVFLDILYRSIKETESDSMDEYKSDAQEDKPEEDDERVSYQME